MFTGRKPSWTNIPEELKFLCQDADGNYYFYENKPSINEQAEQWLEVTGKCYSAGSGSYNKNWRRAIEEKHRR